MSGKEIRVEIPVVGAGVIGAIYGWAFS